MRISTIAAMVLALSTGQAGAQSSMVDLSTPMTGKSKHVFNTDGTPVELGVQKVEETEKQAAARRAAAAVAATPASLLAASPAQGDPSAPAASSSGRSGYGVIVGIGAPSSAPQAQEKPKQAGKSASSPGRIRIRRR